MHLVIPLLLLAALLFGPQLWARWVLRTHARPREDFPGTGGEFARHLLDRLGLHTVGLEATDSGDHYDPATRTVRLSRENLDGRSLTAVAVAAHEVGHAMQHAEGYRPLALRQQLATLSNRVQKVSGWLVLALPLLGVASHSPLPMGAAVLVGLAGMGLGIVVHLVTLPVEFDASFGRALPILERGYIGRRDRRAARSVLRACALTYVAAAFANLLNVWRWVAVFRR